MMWQIQKTSEKSTFSFAEFISGGGKIEKHYKDLTEKSSMSWTFLLVTLEAFCTMLWNYHCKQE